jgi:hypothetical protein
MQGLVQQLGKGLLGYHCISGDPTGMLWEKKYQVCPQSCKPHVLSIPNMQICAQFAAHKPHEAASCGAAVLPTVWDCFPTCHVRLCP